MPFFNHYLQISNIIVFVLDLFFDMTINVLFELWRFIYISYCWSDKTGNMTWTAILGQCSQMINIIIFRCDETMCYCSCLYSRPLKSCVAIDFWVVVFFFFLPEEALCRRWSETGSTGGPCGRRRSTGWSKPAFRQPQQRDRGTEVSLVETCQSSITV